MHITKTTNENTPIQNYEVNLKYLFGEEIFIDDHFNKCINFVNLAISKWEWEGNIREGMVVYAVFDKHIKTFSDMVNDFYKVYLDNQEIIRLNKIFNNEDLSIENNSNSINVYDEYSLQEARQKAIEYMEKSLAEDYCDWQEGKQTLDILKDYQEEYDDVFRPAFESFVHENILPFFLEGLNTHQSDDLALLDLGTINYCQTYNLGNIVIPLYNNTNGELLILGPIEENNTPMIQAQEQSEFTSPINHTVNLETSAEIVLAIEQIDYTIESNASEEQSETTDHNPT